MKHEIALSYFEVLLAGHSWRHAHIQWTLESSNHETTAPSFQLFGIHDLILSFLAQVEVHVSKTSVRHEIACYDVHNILGI